MSVRALGVLCALVISALLAGCAGSPGAQAPPSTSAAQQAFVARVDAVCQQALDSHRGHAFPVPGFDPNNPGRQQLPAVGRYLSRYGHLAQTVTALRSLRPPADEASGWHHFLALANLALANSRRQIAAADSRDVPGFVATVRVVDHLAPRLNAAGAAFGFRSGSSCEQVFG
ncbi:MAG TPA: hypothetical protein VFI30_05915 [Nocardioidaceae bacterium]|nr:hypothetical protein [Nocardioidaceae bacterium]